MNKALLITIIIVAIVIILAVLGVILMQYPAQSNANKSPAVTAPNTPINNPAPSAAQTANAYNIAISGFAFSPTTLNIKKGDKVAWTNQDSVSHTVTSDSGNELDSNLLSKDKIYEHVFNSAGTYAYHCTPHSSMKAKIIVE